MSSQTQLSKTVETPQAGPVAEMIFIPGGEFRMGSDVHYPEEAPAHRVGVGAFWIDSAPVTNRQFRKFVNATKHVTFAEITPGRRIIRARCRTCSRRARSSFRLLRSRSISRTGRNGGSSNLASTGQ